MSPAEVLSGEERGSFSRTEADNRAFLALVMLGADEFVENVSPNFCLLLDISLISVCRDRNYATISHVSVNSYTVKQLVTSGS